MMRQEIVARRHFDDTHARLKAFSDDPCLDLIRPSPFAPPPRLDNLAPAHKAIATLCHAQPPSAHTDLLAGA